MLLHLICLIFKERGDLPAKRIDVYKEGINLLFEKWNQFNARVNLDMPELRKALRRIAAITFEKGKSYFEEDEILPLIENSPSTLSDIEFLSGLLIKTNWRIYFFSHQIFQEYLTAEEFVDSQLIYSNLFKHVTDKRWREVFLLVSALMQSAEELLWIMENKIDLLLNSEKKLQIFLYWVYHKSSNFISNKVKARLFYISLYVDFFIDAEMDKLSEFEIENLEIESSSYIYLANELGLKLELNLNCVINDAVTLFSVFNGTLEYELEYDEVDNTSLCLSQDIDTIMGLDIDPKFKQSLQELKELLPDWMDTWEIYYQEWWQAEGQSWIEKMRAASIKYSNIGYDWQFSDKQKKLLKQYYDANNLLLDCLNNGCNVSPEVRALIEDNLFLPLDSSLS
ncbi:MULTISPECIES: NACHT domain-containing protein [Calothrix]|uniref:NACHT conflict system C-terminal helical domain-containing protein n=2 Tax=Calothrix TaxID=1186 RepID=A0ABR8AKX5_9CYAN|nr:MULTISPECIES: hypothetical protein [Calothrix]MBD2200720.1 hypothetical protein [Calothrix parietina FACHB-288]MBD2229762.1 hypothetical protein [Calothrix anomala FACHB-343]